VGRRRTVDHLIRNITLKTMDVCAARTADAEVVVALSRVIGPGFPLPKMEPSYISNREAASDEEFGLMLRATGFVPWINGLRETVAIDGHRYLDGGLVHRVPLEMIPKDRYDELWIAACSPNGLRELHHEIETSDRPERLVVVTPSRPLPVNRWTMEWSKISRAIELGRQDIEAAIEQTQSTDRSVFIGAASGLFQV
jgi:predicted patatin/cPLA2 family phospholipase